MICYDQTMISYLLIIVGGIIFLAAGSHALVASTDRRAAISFTAGTSTLLTSPILSYVAGA